MKRRLLALLLATLPLHALAQSPADAPDLPPKAQVLEALLGSPMVRADSSCARKLPSSTAA